MAITLGYEASPEEIGAMVADRLGQGETYVHLQEVPFTNLDAESQVAYIRQAASVIGNLSLSTSAQTSDVWRLDTVTSPSTNRIPYHSDNPSYASPEQYVGFWNVKSSSEGGENVLLSIDDIMDFAASDAATAELVEELHTSNVTFSHGSDSYTAPILDSNPGTVRFDRRYIDAGHIKLADRFTSLLETQLRNGHVIKMTEGDVLFFDNRRLVHARESYTELGRLSFRTRITQLGSLE